MSMAGRVMNWFSRLRNWRIVRSGTHQDVAVRVVSQEEHFARALGQFEPYVIKVQSVLIWENPIISVLCIIAVNFLFWLAINFECRFYGLLFTAILLGFVYDVWVKQIWPEISVPAPESRWEREDWTDVHPKVLSVPEISRYLSQADRLLRDNCNSLRNLRDAQPGLFCCITCVCFAVLTLVGRALSGPVISYCVVMLLMTGPGICLHLVPPSIVEKVCNIRSAFHNKDKGTDSEVEDYLPEQTGENLALLQQAGELIDDEQQDESLIIAQEFGLELASVDTPDGPVMPDIDEGSTDGLDISEFDLSAPPSQGGSTDNNHKRALDVDASDSEEAEDAAGIHFQSLHYNRDSSEEEEQAFAQGLAFVEASQSATTTTSAGISLGEMLSAAKNIVSLGAMGQSLISSVIGGSSQNPIQDTPRPKRVVRDDHSSSSGESEEFEMISQEDLS